MSAAAAAVKADFGLIAVLTRHVFSLKNKLSSDKQLLAIQYFVACTLGKPRKPGSAPPRYVPLTHAQIARQVGCSVRQIVDILADAEKRNLIESFDQAEAEKRGLKPAGHPQAKWYGACPERWEKAPKYEPPKPILMPAPEDEDGDEPEDGDAKVVDVPADQPLVLMPGAKSRPVPWVSTAKKYAFDCSGVTVPLSISRVVGVGVVRFKISDSNQQVAASSQNANRRRNSEPPMKPSSQVNSRVSAGMSELTAAVGRYCIPDDDAIPLLVRACRKVAPDVTPAEIAYFVDVKGPRAAKAETPLGFLVTVVPPCLKGESIASCRRALKARDEQIRRAEEVMTAQTLEAARAFLAAAPDDPLVRPEDREWAEQILKSPSKASVRS